ncbi:MAG TPA: hypothetical protein VHN16_14340 [Streptosporangiaceae bacterium]|nr:hypothetical protein [Streptosporangiaceae bacterium]
MRRTDNGTQPAAARAGRSPEDGLLPELSLYERLIDHGIAIADSRRDGIVDHVTARRLAIWFAARPQEPDFARSLVRFVDTGAISPDLKTQLRIRGRSPDRPDQPQAARLLEYCRARGKDVGWVGRNFGAACDQIDRADLMLAEMQERALHGLSDPAPAPEADSPPIIALAQANPDSRTVSLVLDEATASIALFAMAAHADEREAHVREVERHGQTLPEDSYGRRNRQAIATRETRVAARLRAVERAYRIAIERNVAPKLPEPTKACRSPDHATDREIEME